MAISDIIVSNMTILYLVIIVVIKGYGELTGKSYGGAWMLVLSTTMVVVLLVCALTWDLSRKVATYVVVAREENDVTQMCRGGICWHGVAVKSPASEIRFRLPRRHVI